MRSAALADTRSPDRRSADTARRAAWAQARRRLRAARPVVDCARAGTAPLAAAVDALAGVLEAMLSAGPGPDAESEAGTTD